ncbi:uncharacterized protein LOC105182722 isoform X3 [Harpegnathos saltator]|uniref:uncharacterized protein LOC105182722 isoform X3 n=1 Tax=Harpegnathos saltator TaxID=610380 RepID=UPI000948D312|nr:uncharacterized protein LOC105182722 isoform X3 [Harpegnathos saltator]
MDFLGNKYYKLNRRLLLLVGLWPYDHCLFKYCQMMLCNVIVILTMASQVAKLITLRQNIGFMLQIVSPIVLGIVFIIKYQTFCLIPGKLRRLMDHIERDWNMLKDKRELDIIGRYTYIGSMCTLSFTIFGAVATIVCILLPFIPIIHDILTPLNISRPRQLLFPGEYYIDQRKYFYVISLYLDLALILIIITLLGTETLYVTHVQHACGLFQIASYRMNQAFDESLSQVYTPEKRTIFVYQRIIEAVHIHKRALESIAYLITLRHNIDLVLNILAPTVPCLIYAVKYQTFSTIPEKLKHLMEHVKKDWNMLKDKRELEIIEKYIYIGNMCCMGCAILGVMGIIIFLLTPFVPNILDILAPINVSRTRQLPIPGQYFVDQQKYFYAIVLHLDINVIIIVTTLLGTESLYIMHVQHACGLFRIASYRVSRAFDDNLLQAYAPRKRMIIVYQRIIEAVHIHKRALEFSESLWSSLSVSYSILLTIGIISLIINLFCIPDAMALRPFASAKIIAIYDAKKYEKLQNGHRWYIYFIIRRLCDGYEYNHVIFYGTLVSTQIIPLTVKKV